MPGTAGCLCGAVRFDVNITPTETGACHCGMCRKASGGVFLSVEVPADAITFTKDDGLATYRSSDWAERGFCKLCGSSLFYRLAEPGPHSGTWYVALGSFDDPEGIVMTSEIYIDKKPGGYGFAGETSKMTEAEVMKMFGFG